VKNQPDKLKKIDSVGGQAVIEGVMMRSPHFWAVAVTNPNGEIVLQDNKVNSLSNKYKIFRRPLFRGVVALIENLIIGFKALNFSASVSSGEEGEEEKLSGFQIALSFSMAFVLVVALFMALPFFAAKFTRAFIQNRFLFTFIEGFIRIGVFVGYVYLISLFKDIRRVFEYHGAEHKVVNSFENGEALSVANASKYSTIHLRCGTNFVVIVFVIAVLVFSFLPTSSFYLRVVGKILLAPIIAGLAYEIIKVASKTKSKFIKGLVKPGLLLQKVTTREPDENQLKVALAALKRVLELEKSYEG
jgi:uncharacterized protein YqhQ